MFNHGFLFEKYFLQNKLNDTTPTFYKAKTISRMQASARTQSGLYQNQNGPYQTQSGPHHTQSLQYQSQSLQYQSQVGQASQYSHAASRHSDGNGNQVTQRPSASSKLYDLITANITHPQSGYFIPQNGAYWSGQTPNWQTARAPQQTVSSLQVPAGGRSNNYHQGTFTHDNAAMQASCVNVQSGNNGPQQALHQNSLNRPNPSPPNGIQHNPFYLLQGFVSNSNQQVIIQAQQPVGAQDVSVNCVPPNRLQCGDAKNASYQNVNRIPVNTLLTLPAPATSVQHTQMSPAGTSTTTYSQRMTHNDGFQHGVLPHTTAPSQMTSSQPLQSISHVMTSDSSSGQSLTQITEMATSSSHSATHPNGSQYSDGRNLPKKNGPHTGTLHYMPNSLGTRLATLPNAPPPYYPVQKGISSNQHSSEAPPPYFPVQKGISSNQHSSEAPPQDRPVYRYIIMSEDESGTPLKVVYHGHNADNNGISKGLKRRSSKVVRQPEQCRLSSGKTCKRRGQPSLPQTPASSSKLKDNNNRTSPGHAGQKTIPIVQPLSQANNNDISSEMSSGQCKQTTTTDESGSVCEETAIVKPFVDHIAESTSLTQRLKSVNGVSLEMSTEEGADTMTNHDTGQSETLPNYLHAEEVESQPSGRMQATPTSHQPVTTEVPSSRSEAICETKRQDEPIAEEFDLSSVPLTPWTYDKLTKLVEVLHKKKKRIPPQNDVTIPDVASTILSMFWDATYENVLMEMDSHTNLMNEIEEFCSKQLASDSVILLMVSRKSWRNLVGNNCMMLKHDAVHRENTYKSPWLNTNEQLDDIDKEFDFPWSLKYGLTTLERDEQPTLIKTENGFPENTASEVQNEGVSPTEITALCDDDYLEKQASSARDGLNQTPVPLENATADSIDSIYSFKIDVLPPEEARALFEKLNSKQMNTEKTEDHSEIIMYLEDDLPEMASVRLGAVKLNSEQLNTEKTDDHSEMFMNVEDDLPEIASVGLGAVKLKLNTEQVNTEKTEDHSKMIMNVEHDLPEMASVRLGAVKLNREQVNTEKTEDHSEMIMNLEDDLPEMASVRLGEVKLNSEQLNTEKTDDHSEIFMNVEDDLPEIVSVGLGAVKLNSEQLNTEKTEDHCEMFMNVEDDLPEIVSVGLGAVKLKLNTEQVNTEKTEDHSEMIMNVEDDLPEMASVRLGAVKLNSEQVNTEKTDDHFEMIINVEDDLPEMASVRLGAVKLENKVQAPIQEFCCTMRLMEMMGGSNPPSLCNCQSRREQSADGVNAKSCEEERDVQMETFHVMKLMKLDPTMESKNKVDIGNAMDKQTLTPTWMKQCDNLIDLTEEDEMLHSQTNMEPKRILPSCTPSVDSNIIVREIDDFFSCSETELSILNSELEIDYGQSEQKRPGPTETQFNTRQKQTLTFQKEVSLYSQLTSTEKTNQVTFLSSLSLQQNNFCIPHPENNLKLKARRKRKRQAETPDSLPLPKKIKVYLEPITVKLALFGSLPHKEHETVINGQRSSNSHNISYTRGTPQPPTTLSVTVGYRRKGPTEITPIIGSPDKRGISEEPSETGPKSDSPVEQPMLEGPSETGPVFHSTVKQQMYEEWRNRFVPTKRKSRGRVKSLNRFVQTKRKSRGRVMRLKKGSFASSRRVRPETTKARPPTVTEELPVASEGKSPPGTDETKHAWSAQRESFLKSLRQRVEKSKTFPKTFNFNHGPGDPEESTNPQLDIPDPDKEHGQDSERPAKRLKGVWAPDPPKKYTPLPSRDSQVPKTSTIFQQFQKKYKKKKKKKKKKK